MTEKKEKELMKYSPGEQMLLDIIRKRHGKKKRITTDELIAERYKNEEVPFNAASSVRATLRVLDKKMQHNEEPLVIKRSGQVGPHNQEIWLEKR